MQIWCIFPYAHNVHRPSIPKSFNLFVNWKIYPLSLENGNKERNNVSNWNRNGFTETKPMRTRTHYEIISNTHTHIISYHKCDVKWHVWLHLLNFNRTLNIVGIKSEKRDPLSRTRESTVASAYWFVYVGLKNRTKTCTQLRSNGHAATQCALSSGTFDVYASK